MRTRKTRTEYFETLSEEELYRHAVNRALYILEHTDKSEADIRRKLKTAGYPEAIVDRAVEYVKGYHYIDDSRYALNYVRLHAALLSRREITNKLMQKGISREDAYAAFSVYEEEQTEPVGRAVEKVTSGCESSDLCSEITSEGLSTEETAAVNALRKKLCGRTTIDEAGKMKIIGYLYRKGFARGAIYKAFDVLGISVGEDVFPN
ncbi:MAG: recombination regulator RecX [Lachnospiraceae bacterium]|nr:recombination regulator RecX [Lachnospiraceae bacterium]